MNGVVIGIRAEAVLAVAAVVTDLSMVEVGVGNDGGKYYGVRPGRLRAGARDCYLLLSLHALSYHLLMRNYHIRISLASEVNAPATSSSYSPPSAHSASAFIPSSIFQPLPSHKPVPAGRRYTINGKSNSNEARSEDYRFGSIRIDWVDCAPVSMSVAGPKKVGVGKEKAADARRRGEL